MAALTPPPAPLLADQLRSAWHHRRYVAASTLLGLVGGLVWALAQPTTFSSTASVALTPVPKYLLPAGAGLAPPAVTIDTDAQLVTSPDVLTAVAQALGTEPARARQQISVTATPNSRVLHVTVSGSSPAQVADAANEAATALVRVRRETLGALRTDQLRLLRLWTAGQEAVLAQQQRSRLVIPASDELFAQVLQVRSGLGELEEARLSPAEVVTPGSPPQSADPANAEVHLTSGAMLGLLAGCLLIAARDRLSQHHRPPADEGAQATGLGPSTPLPTHR